MSAGRQFWLPSAVAILLICAHGPSVRAQEPAPGDSLRVDTTGQTITVRRTPGQPAGASRVPVDESKWPDPTLTLVKSMLVPGWGQITNKAYVKAAFAIGLETAFFTGALINWNQANDALERFRQTGNLQDYYDYQYYWGNRSDFLWLFGLTVFVSMFDAYVDAHLKPYSEDTIPGVEPPKGVKIVIPF